MTQLSRLGVIRVAQRSCKKFYLRKQFFNITLKMKHKISVDVQKSFEYPGNYKTGYYWFCMKIIEFYRGLIFIDNLLIILKFYM